MSKAGRIANKIHKAYASRIISAPEAIRKLEAVDAYYVLSEAQSIKLSDLTYHYTTNRHMFDEKGFRV